jgi:uncharacterized protein
MILNLLKADEVPLEFEGEFDLSAHEAVRDVVSLAGPVAVKGRVEKAARGYRLEAELSWKGEVACSRCLGAIPMKHDGEFEILLQPEKDQPEEDEHALSPGELDVAWFPESKEVDLVPLVAEQVVLAIPMKPLCREDCAGLCATCGANRNEAPCACPQEAPDSRWSALEVLRERLPKSRG